jgi:cytochrome c biogenesis protein CcdA
MDAAVILSFAYTAGVLSMLAPCSFAMLPSYISYYLNRDAGGESVVRGVGNGILATLGSGAVRGSIGVLAIVGMQGITGSMYYFSLAVGVLLVVMGALMLAGRDLSIPVPVTIRKRKGPMGVFIFGALYSLASFGCTAAVFIGMVLVASAQGFGIALASVAIYVAGIGTLLIPMTVAVSTSRTIMLDRLKAFMPRVRLISGAVLVAMGIYLVLYNLKII